MNRVEDRISGEAAAWHLASLGSEMDWEGFTAWLEADPHHRRAYDEIALADALLTDHRDKLTSGSIELPANRSETTGPARFSWKRWTGMAIAASLLALLIVPNFISAPPEIYETGKTSRAIALGDGSSIMLAPNSRIVIEGSDKERLALSGGAWFDIVHDPSRTLTITAGDTRISDIGTQFDVQSESGKVRVEVAQGKVKVESDALSQPIDVPAGKGLLFDAGAGNAIVARVPVEDVGQWRSGQLTYNATPLALVAADLARYAGVSVQVPASLRDRRFSGTLVLVDGEAALRDLSQVMELVLYRDGGGYRLGERTR